MKLSCSEQGWSSQTFMPPVSPRPRMARQEELELLTSIDLGYSDIIYHHRNLMLFVFLYLTLSPTPFDSPCLYATLSPLPPPLSTCISLSTKPERNSIIYERFAINSSWISWKAKCLRPLLRNSVTTLCSSMSFISAKSLPWSKHCCLASSHVKALEKVFCGSSTY